MTLLDAAGLVSLLAGQPAAPEVASLLRQESVAIASINLAEAQDKLERVAGLPRVELEHAIDDFVAAGVEVIPLNETDARAAGRLRVRHYHHRTAPLSIADCVALVTAIARQARLATSDSALARTAQSEGVEIFPLPNSSGQRPALAW